MSTAAYSPPDVTSPRRARAPRSKSGCLTCRRRKVRCNEQRPRCSHCERLNLQCNWRPSTSSSQTPRQSSESTISHHEVGPDTNTGGSSPLGGGNSPLLQESRQTIVDGPFNDTFDYASFMWENDINFQQPQPFLDSPDLNGSQGAVTRNRNDPDDSAEERLLKDYFIRSVVPPIIAQVETQLRWSSMRQVLVSMSSTSAMVHYAILAFAELLLGRKSNNQPPKYQRYYENARLELSKQQSQSMFTKEDHSSTALEHLLAALFFLSYIDLLEGRIVDAHSNLKQAYEAFQETDKSQLRLFSKRLISWLRLLDARAVSAGGEGLFLSEIDDNLTQSSPASTEMTENNESSEANVEDVLFDTLYQPGFYFFQRIQSFMGRISKIDPWHRSRGTVDDETEVMNIAAKISRDLGTLWAMRPPLMDYALNGKLTSAHISSSLVFTITRTFRTYFANFNASKIHLHRVAYKHLPLSVDTEQAIANIRNTARLMVDAGERENMGGEQKMLPVNMLWPLLMWGCEENDKEMRDWIVVQIRGMEGVATNARITAQVLGEVQRRQDVGKVRVDVRTVMHDIFNSCFAIV
ncbi:fungal-specific transcription factor domain-containing protein [Hyaloscypha finlandica]|nr:fungal-specific transcription factor domain-containing protein [Hyaloscypha finlandica]